MNRSIGWLVAALSLLVLIIGVTYFYSSSPARFAYQEPAYDATALPRINPGYALDFSNGQNKSALLSGWSIPEAAGVWSEGHSSYLGFILEPDSDSRFPQSLVLKAGAYVNAQKLPEQKIEVWTSGVKIAEFGIKVPNVEITIPLSGITLAADKPLILGIYLPDASSPEKLGDGPDPRQLAILLKAVETQ